MTTKKTTKKKRGKKKIPAGMLHAKTGDVGWPWPLRPMQQEAYDQFERGIRRFGLFWHRRAGKDVFGMSVARNQMAKRVGSYVHFFPKHAHAKRALWRGVDPRKGANFIDIAFGDIEAARNNQDMFVEAMNGSTWTLLGSDNYDSNIIGGNVVGVVFSEWAICNPKAWEYIRPIIRENNGWAMFITTFRGRNHAWQMSETLRNNPDWYIDIRTVEQTTELDGSRIITDEMVDADRADGMPESLVQQEYYCNPEAIAEGSIYGKQVENLRKDTARHSGLWNPNKPVYAVWNFDLPIYAACLYVQPGTTPLILDAKIWENVTLGDAIAECYRQPFPVQKHLIHGNQHELVKPLSDLDVYPDVMFHDSDFIRTTATAAMINACMINKDKCELLLDSLGGYVRRLHFDAHTADEVFSTEAAMSWHSRLAKALETWATWDYHSLGSGSTGRKIDYTEQDKVSKVLI